MPSPYVDKNELGQLALRTLAENKQFVKAVTEYANSHAVLANEDIYSKTGIKLVANGTPISGKFYDRLIAHKLLRPIEQSLSAPDVIDAKKIVLLTHAETRRVPSLLPLLENPELLNRMQGLLSDLIIPAPLALKLTVMQAARPKLFQHSLITSMLSMVLAVRGNMSREELRALALASIFHDIGETFLAPSLFAENHKITEDEHQHLFTHPITGYMMLQCFKETSQETAVAVLQHHERLDGSGYPYRLPGDKINKISRYLAIAEFCASLLERYGADKRIQLKLWLNQNKYDAEAIGILIKLFNGIDSPSIELPNKNTLMTQMFRVGKIFEDWVVLRESLSPTEVTAISYIIERVNNLHLLLLESGYDQTRIDEILEISSGENPEIYMEINVLLEELSWRFKDLYGEVQRKVSRHGSSLVPSVRESVFEWLKQASSLENQTEKQCKAKSRLND